MAEDIVVPEAAACCHAGVCLARRFWITVNLFSARRYMRLVGELNRGQFLHRSRHVPKTFRNLSLRELISSLAFARSPIRLSALHRTHPAMANGRTLRLCKLRGAAGHDREIRDVKFRCGMSSVTNRDS
jgi:hypothetical protein